MKLPVPHAPRPSAGIALITVMVVIFVLSVLAGGFAYAMKIEMRLAQNHANEAELEWLGRSGVELARYVLALQAADTRHPWDALNQKWAGGTGDTNEALAEINLDNYPLGNGSLSIKIIDQERRFNINIADRNILHQGMNLVGVDSAEASSIVSCILDWRDPDDQRQPNGAESDYYLSLKHPYYAKNGVLDNINELLLVKGITPDIFWGPNGPRDTLDATTAEVASEPILQAGDAYAGPVGLVDLFSVIGERQVNVNTASAAVLQLFPGIDDNIANGIIQARAGPDGVEGNEDDTPFRNPGELVNVAGIGQQGMQRLIPFFSVRSITFEVHVRAKIANSQREYVSLLRRVSGRDVQILYFHWK
jgi:type II secretory pathway component PulK